VVEFLWNGGIFSHGNLNNDVSPQRSAPAKFQWDRGASPAALAPSGNRLVDLRGVPIGDGNDSLQVGF